VRIVLTGACGFVASHLLDRLLADGHEVIGVDNLATGKRVNVAHHANNESFRLIEADVVEPLAIDGPLDWVLHLASPASPVAYMALPIQTLRVNAEGTHHLLELALEKRCAFLLASTSEVYGDPLVHPQTEAYWGNVNPVGPRSFQYVDDLVEGIVRLMAADTTGPLNLGNPTENTMLELAEMVRTMTATSSKIEFLPLPDDDPRRRRPDISGAREQLGWEPRVALRDGLARTIEAFRAQPAWSARG
jgi:nucleoside-diphosphate-sugar epimerase